LRLCFFIIISRIIKKNFGIWIYVAVFGCVCWPAGIGSNALIDVGGFDRPYLFIQDELLLLP
jgi:hypothetical protein